MTVIITIVAQETETGIQTDISASRNDFTEKEMTHTAAILEVIEDAFKANGGKKEVILGDNVNVH
ncbi:TPA: hypothetical protein KEY88_001976 [Serratia marcescens]|nr:hypothetical protein [Serratia marcescens]